MEVLRSTALGKGMTFRGRYSFPNTSETDEFEGDFDYDGLTSAAELFLLFQNLCTSTH